MGRLQHSCAQDTGCSPSTVIFLKCQWDPGPLEATLRGSPAAIESTIYPLRTVPSALHCRTLRGVGVLSAQPFIRNTLPPPAKPKCSQVPDPAMRGAGEHICSLLTQI